jgi:hypothetical protein
MQAMATETFIGNMRGPVSRTGGTNPMDGCSTLKRVYGLKSDITPCSKVRRHARSVPLGDITLVQSIISSARTRNDSGIVKPSALAVTRLMTSSNLVGCSTGRSPGFVPRRILST